MALVLPKSRRSDAAKTASPKNEKARAESLSANRVRGSGVGREKGDVRKKGVLRLELKTTSKKSFSVTQEMLDKIEEAALTSNEVPFLEIEFINESGKVLRRCCVVPSYVVELIAVEGIGAV